MVLRRVGADVSERLLSPREQARVGFVLASAATEIHSRIERGETLRSDGFFDPRHGERSDAEEVSEGVLLKSQREPEEKKLPYMAHPSQTLHSIRRSEYTWRINSPRLLSNSHIDNIVF